MEIYKITNLIDGKAYIGQTINNFRRRYDSFKWWKSNCINRHLKNAVKKYGPENFLVEILEKDIETEEELNEKEISLIQIHNTMEPNGYNIMAGGQKLKNRSHSLESRDKMSIGQRTKFFEEFYVFKNHKDGKIHKTKNLSRFCRENNLSIPMMVHVNQRRYKRYLSWTLPETELKHWVMRSPSGEIFDLIEGEFRPFCDKMNLHRSALTQALKNNWKGPKGWDLLKTYYN